MYHGHRYVSYAKGTSMINHDQPAWGPTAHPQPKDLPSWWSLDQTAALLEECEHWPKLWYLLGILLFVWIAIQHTTRLDILWFKSAPWTYCVWCVDFDSASRFWMAWSRFRGLLFLWRFSARAIFVPAFVTTAIQIGCHAHCFGAYPQRPRNKVISVYSILQSGIDSTIHI